MSIVFRKIERQGITLTLHRKTVLSDARFRAYLARVSPLLDAIAAAVESPTEVVDIALTAYLRIVSQASGAENLPVRFIELDDDAATIHERCVDYLTKLNPDLVEVWDKALDALDKSWAEPDLTPNPPETLEKKA